MYLLLLVLHYFSISSHLFIKLLFEATHQSVHHLVAGSFDLQTTLQLGVLASQLLEGLIA